MYAMASLNLIRFNLIQFKNFNSFIFTFIIWGSDTNIFKIYKKKLIFLPYVNSKNVQLLLDWKLCNIQYVQSRWQLATLSYSWLSLPLQLCWCSWKWKLLHDAYDSFKGQEKIQQNFFFKIHWAASDYNYQYCAMFSINIML
jgi:hypothetical protein